MQIVNKSYFQKENYLFIPLSVVDPSGSVTPDNATEIDNLCIQIERDIMLNALGLTLYNEFKTLTSITIELPQNDRWKKLIEGDEYDGKVWLGLDNDYSLIAYRVFEQFNTETSIRLSATGAKQVQGENAIQQTPKYLISTANQRFINQYQDEYLHSPIIVGNFVDWFGSSDSIEKSLYGYLVDKKADFPEWSQESFKVYGTQNSFGL
jgi:hypothetical protein